MAMASNTTIRRATASDAETIYRFICRLEGEDPTREEFDSIFLKNLENPDCYYLIAEKNGRSVAFVGMQIQRVLHHTARIAEIIEMFVLPEYRGDGIGEMLYWYTKDIAQEKGCKFFEVACNNVRERALDFFSKMGFEKTHYKFTERL